MELIAFLSTHWTWILIILAILTVVARATKWKWDDKLIEAIKSILNLLMPGRKLYSIKDIENKGIAELEKEEQEYRERGFFKRLKDSFLGLIGKNK